MKKISFLLSFVLFSFFLVASVHTNDIIVNTKSSTVKWTGAKPTGSHSGTINISSGKLVFDHGKLVGGDFTIDMNTIQNTDIESERKRNYLVDHLKNEDFFNVSQFPTAKLLITNVDRLPDNAYKVRADLTIKDITHSVTFSAVVQLKGNNFLATANIEIDRTKWDVVYKSGNVFKDLGDKIIYDEISFDVFLLSEK